MKTSLENMIIDEKLDLKGPGSLKEFFEHKLDEAIPGIKPFDAGKAISKPQDQPMELQADINGFVDPALMTAAVGTLNSPKPGQVLKITSPSGGAGKIPQIKKGMQSIAPGMEVTDVPNATGGKDVVIGKRGSLKPQMGMNKA